MAYANGQIPLHELAKKRCNFQLVGGDQQELIALQRDIMD